MNDNEVKAEDDAKNQKVLQNINKNKEITDTEINEEDLKKMKTLFCIDASESVKGKTTYHNVTKNIFNKFYKNGDIIWLWGSSTKKQTESQFRSWNDNKESGLGETASELIADILNIERNSGVEHLVIITEGFTNPGSLDKSDEKMKNYNINLKFISKFIISSSNYDKSIGSPYSRGYPSVTYIYI